MMATQSTITDTNALAEQGWASLPRSYRIPDRIPTLAEAQKYCRELAESHYENFHVASWLLPQRLRPHFHSIYAYCRISDDLGDEVASPAQALALLDVWQAQLDACYRGEARHPVFVALGESIRICDIPKQPFADLLTAFRQDQTITRYATMENVLAYCRNSANPVGRLVLYACGYRDEERFALSDETCSALQLANFWQDVREDFARGRVYIPQDAMAAAGVDERMIADGNATPEFRELMREQIAYTRAMFARGAKLIAIVDRELAVDLDLFTRGGVEILRAIEARKYDVLSARPTISKPRKLKLLLQALTGRFVPGMRPAGKMA
ncbi:MAG TPA: squalene synthase HpnC [Acidobacteriaceae bacterium]|jgi:squalene synthase HpnC